MALNKQVHIYSIDTSAFYLREEKSIHNKMNRLYVLRSKLKKELDNKNTSESKRDNSTPIIFDLITSQENTLKECFIQDAKDAFYKSWHTIQKLYRDWETDRKSTRLNSSHSAKSRMPSSA